MNHTGSTDTGITDTYTHTHITDTRTDRTDTNPDTDTGMATLALLTSTDIADTDTGITGNHVFSRLHSVLQHSEPPVSEYRNKTPDRSHPKKVTSESIDRQ